MISSLLMLVWKMRPFWAHGNLSVLPSTSARRGMACTSKNRLIATTSVLPPASPLFSPQNCRDGRGPLTQSRQNTSQSICDKTVLHPFFLRQAHSLPSQSISPLCYPYKYSFSNIGANLSCKLAAFVLPLWSQTCRTSNCWPRYDRPCYTGGHTCRSSSLFGMGRG